LECGSDRTVRSGLLHFQNIVATNSKAKPAPKDETKHDVLRKAPVDDERGAVDFVVITGMSGSGKGSVLKSFEDLGYYCVDNLPVDLIPTFAALCRTSAEISRAALVVDVREGQGLERFPEMFRKLKSVVRARLLFLEASSSILVRRYSETRRPHPLSAEQTIQQAINSERQRLKPIRAMADMTIDTTKFNVHELRALIHERFRGKEEARTMLVSCTSFGYRYGVPSDSDLVFDVRFLPNPNYIPQFRHLSGKHPKVAKYIKSFPQTIEFVNKISELLIYLIPHYIREGKSYLTIAFGCTGGQHRSVAMAEAIHRRLADAGYVSKVVHKDVVRR
jgi:RNase adapter protein RapZ